MGDILPALSLLPALLAVFVVPGLALSFAVFPNVVAAGGGVIERAGAAILLSLLVAGTTGLTLAVAGALTPLTVIVALGATTLAGLGVAHRRGARPSLPRPTRPASPWRAVLPLVLALGLAGAVWAPEVRLIQRDRMPTSGVTWYYWDLADQIARHGSLPEESLEWGRARPYPTTYLFFSSATAAYEQLTNADVRAQMEAFRFALLASALVIGWLFFRRFLAPGAAGLALLLTFGAFFFLNRFSAYRPESFGLTLSLAGAWLLLTALDDREQSRGRRLPAALAALAFAGAYLSHAIPLTAIALFTASAIVAGWCIQRRRPRADLRLIGGVGLAAAIIGVAITFAVDQEFPLARAATPGGEVDGRDVTWQIILATEGADSYRPAPDFRGMLDTAAREPWERLDLEGRPYLFGLLLLPFAAWRTWSPKEHALALGAALFGIALGMLVIGFYVVYTTYVPQRTGPDRLAPYVILVLAPLAALGLAGAARAAAWLAGPAPLRRASAEPLLLAAMTGILGLTVLLPSARSFVRRLDRQSISPTAYAALRDLDATLPEHAVVLANAYTDGSISGIVHRLALTNGRVPFQAVPEFRDETIRLMERTKRFFADPASEPSLLAEYGVTHLMVARRTWVLGGSALYPVDLTALATTPMLRLVESYDNLDVYTVAGTARSPIIPDTDRRDALPWLLLALGVSGVAVATISRTAGLLESRPPDMA